MKGPGNQHNKNDGCSTGVMPPAHCLQQPWSSPCFCRCYVTRTSLKCVAPGLSYGSGKFESASGNTIDRWAVGDDTRVCFQYSATDAVPKGSPGYLSNDELYAELVKDLKEYGAQDVQVGPTQLRYCHHLPRAACWTLSQLFVVCNTRQSGSVPRMCKLVQHNCVTATTF